jgi:adenosine deaminase
MAPAAVSGPAGEALARLSHSQITFIQSLPKAELHAHLNGSIPIALLQDLAREFTAATASRGNTVPSSELATVHAGIERLQRGVELEEIGDFFGLFPAIYALTGTPAALGRATRAVLEAFLDGEHPQCTYLELRTGPRAVAGGMRRMEYMRVVLSEVERYPREKAAVIVSLDRRMGDDDLEECVRVAGALREEGRRRVGMDLCGDPRVSRVVWWVV